MYSSVGEKERERQRQREREGEREKKKGRDSMQDGEKDTPSSSG